MTEQDITSKTKAWKAIFDKYNIYNHDFSLPYFISAKNIKSATKHFDKTAEKEVRIICKQDTRESRPDIFKELGLFLLPVKNGEYAILKGEGYIDIPLIKETPKTYKSSLNFKLDTSLIGDSEMQHLDYAYASSLIRHFMKDDSLVLTIRGRKYTPKFEMMVNNNKLTIESVQTEVDAGYEGERQVVLIEAKNVKTENLIIRQLYFPFRQWQSHTNKKVITLFFSKSNNIYSIWKFEFEKVENYNSIFLTDSTNFMIT